MPEEKTSNQLAEDRTDLAVARTVMAVDRSLLAAVRTSLSMIGFGFTIFKFLSQGAGAAETVAMRDTAPRDIGLFLCGLGTVTLILEMVNYWKSVKSLDCGPAYSPWRTPFLSGACIVAMGLWLLVVISINTVLR